MPPSWCCPRSSWSLYVISRCSTKELVLHAGRVRWDVLQRLTAARDQLVDTTRQHLSQVADDIQQAARRVERRRAEAVQQPQGWEMTAEEAAEVIRAIRAWTQGR